MAASRWASAASSTRPKRRPRCPHVSRPPTRQVGPVRLRGPGPAPGWPAPPMGAGAPDGAGSGVSSVKRFCLIRAPCRRRLPARSPRSVPRPERARAVLPECAASRRATTRLPISSCGRGVIERGTGPGRSRASPAIGTPAASRRACCSAACARARAISRRRRDDFALRARLPSMICKWRSKHTLWIHIRSVHCTVLINCIFSSTVSKFTVSTYTVLHLYCKLFILSVE